MKRSFISQIFLLLLLFSHSFAAPQKQEENQFEGVTITGRILQGTKLESFHVDLTELKVRFLKRVEIPTPPVPENWAAMEQKDRESWWKAYAESDAGKKLAARQQELLASADEFESNVEPNGNFIVYDVTPGTYGMTARFDKTIGARTYAFEIFGEIPVSEEANVVELGEKKLVITPIIRTGEPASGWGTVQTVDSTDVTLDDLKGKYILLNFWAADDPSKELQKGLQEAFGKLKANHEIELLSVSLDKKRTTLDAFLKESPLDGLVVHASRESRIARVFGVHTTPGMLLIDPDGVIKMTYPEMIRAFQSGKPSLDVIVDDRITGKDTPTPVDDAKDAKDANDANDANDAKDAKDGEDGEDGEDKK